MRLLLHRQAGAATRNCVLNLLPRYFQHFLKKSIKGDRGIGGAVLFRRGTHGQ